MNFVESHTLVRFIMADDPVQSSEARAQFESFSADSPGYISQVCVTEAIWILRSCYRKPRNEIAVWMRGLLASQVMHFEEEDAVRHALSEYAAGGGDFADCLLAEVAKAASGEQEPAFD